MIIPNKSSKILAVGLCYNVFQSAMLFFKGGDNINILATVSLIIPVVFISYLAYKMNKLAYILILYWFGIQSLIINVNNLVLNWDYGIKFEVMLVYDNLGIDVAAILLFIISIFEIDNVFPDETITKTSTSLIQEGESHLTSRSSVTLQPPTR
jgi:hypothetical protein